ncbi:MAG: molecular chaperone HscC [Fibrobacteres bacterium]|nr:molecular chaperone HscC [Fibrobacterota bacterium]
MAVVGIDLGTTNSLVTAWHDGKVVPIPNALGDHLTPSVVSLDRDGSILVGRAARDRLVTHPRETVATFKRAMGTTQQFQLGRQKFRAEDLSALVLRSLKADAEAFLGEKVTEAVVSVPAYFNELQRKATKAAAQIAGLHVERLINEPTAAAVAYGVGQIERDGTFLVFDLGGGTFDVSILELFERTLEVHASAGDIRLGGEDFRWRMAEACLRDNDLAWESLDNQQRALVMNAAESTKNQLSEAEVALMEFRVGTRDVAWPISRAQYEEICQDLVDRLRLPVERAMRDAKRDPGRIDQILLVGGATRMPMVRRLAERMFGRSPRVDLDPDRVVAIGAGVQAMLKTSETAFQDVVLTDVCPWTLGIDVKSDDAEEKSMFSPIIERNSTVPISRSKRYSATEDFQTQVKIKVYQGESRRLECNVFLGELSVPLPSLPKSENRFDVRFTYDINGILEVIVTHLRTKRESRLVLERNPGTLTPEQIAQRLAELAPLKLHPRETQQVRSLLAYADRLYEERLGEEREEIASRIRAFREVLDRQEPQECEQAIEVFREFLQGLGECGF